MADGCVDKRCFRINGNVIENEFEMEDSVRRVDRGRGLGVRHVQTGLMAVASFMAYSLRSNLSVAVVAMVKNKQQDDNLTLTSEYPTYEWNEETQGIVLSSFFWGYSVTQIPAGILTERLGGHRFLCGAILLCSFLTILLPPCAYLGGWKLVCVNRTLQGVCQGFVYPSIYTLLGVWAPVDERGRLASIALGAQLLGTVAASPLTGFLSSTHGWPSVFYWFGVSGAMVAITIAFLGADTPSKHRMISKRERKYIQDSLGGAKQIKIRVPWRQILTSGPVWAAVLSNAFSSLVFLTFLLKIPTYLGTVLKFEIEKNGVLSALPYFVSWVFTFIFSWLSDFLISRGALQLTSARKIFNSIATGGSAICMMGMAYSGSPAMSVFLLTAFVGILAASFPGVQANFVDLAPNFSGPVFSLSNFLAACFGFTGPIAVGLIVTKTGSAEQWRIVFFSSAALMILSNLIFLVWGTADTQSWNWPNYAEVSDKNNHIETEDTSVLKTPQFEDGS